MISWDSLDALMISLMQVNKNFKNVYDNITTDNILYRFVVGYKSCHITVFKNYGMIFDLVLSDIKNLPIKTEIDTKNFGLGFKITSNLDQTEVLINSDLYPISPSVDELFHYSIVLSELEYFAYQLLLSSKKHDVLYSMIQKKECAKIDVSNFSPLINKHKSIFGTV